MVGRYEYNVTYSSYLNCFAASDTDVSGGSVGKWHELSKKCHFPTAAASEEGWISLSLADESEEPQLYTINSHEVVSSLNTKQAG